MKIFRFYFVLVFFQLLQPEVVGRVKFSNLRPCILSRVNSFQLKASPLVSLIPADNFWSLWAFIAASSAVGLQLENKTSVGKALSGPVCAMLISALATNAGILPMAGSPYILQLQGFVVKLATPLLLLGADLQKIFKETKGLIKAFLLGTAGTIFGSIFSFLLFHPYIKSIGIRSDDWKISAALAAKNIGGGLNFMAVVDILKVSPTTISTGLTVDNILGLLYFPLISIIGQRSVLRASRHRHK